MSTISITRTTTAYSTLITSSDNMTASTTESSFRELERRAEARIGIFCILLSNWQKFSNIVKHADFFWNMIAEDAKHLKLGRWKFLCYCWSGLLLSHHCCCCSSPVVVVALVSEIASVVVVVVVSIGEGGLSSIVVVVVTGGNGIPPCHSHNFIVAAWVLGSSSCVPTTIMPLNSARLPVAFLSNTAITSPFPSKVAGSYRIIS